MEEQVKDYYIYPNAIVDTDNIGEGTRIWAFVHILKDVHIGNNVNICDHCFIEQNVSIGNNVTIKSGVYLWEGITIENDAFIGPNVVFTNDVRPRSKHYKPAVATFIKAGASVGANSTILAGVTIGKYAMSGIGAVITRDVPDYALVYGNPATVMGWVDENGDKLTDNGSGRWIAGDGTLYIQTTKGLVKQ